MTEVKTNRDQALIYYTAKFDDLSVNSVDELEISTADLSNALDSIDPELKQTLAFAIKRIENYHRRQLLESWSFSDENGAELGQRVTPLDKVGIYVPGGKASYPSSVLMAAIPAKLAGVEQIIMTVPAPGNKINPVVLAAARWQASTGFLKLVVLRQSRH